MNLGKLKEAEKEFLSLYPSGFESIEMQSIAKKHNVEKMSKLVTESFEKNKFDNINEIVNNFTKVISRSSLISVFEKVKFKDYAMSMNEEDKDKLSKSIYELIHGNMEKGYELFISVLEKEKLAKWPLVTICPYYSDKTNEVFIKPTTVKGVIKYFEIESLSYKSKPSYEFYKEYKKEILNMKKNVGNLISNDNAAFCGFLMMTMK